MLVLTRKFGEQIVIGEDIVLTVMEGPGGAVRIGIEAPRGVKITRAEVLAAVVAENRAAAAAPDGAEGSLLAALGRSAAPQRPVGRWAGTRATRAAGRRSGPVAGEEA